jgi:hypothetical protein
MSLPRPRPGVPPPVYPLALWVVLCTAGAAPDRGEYGRVVALSYSLRDAVDHAWDRVAQTGYDHATATLVRGCRLRVGDLATDSTVIDPLTVPTWVPVTPPHGRA